MQGRSLTLKGYLYAEIVADPAALGSSLPGARVFTGGRLTRPFAAKGPDCALTQAYYVVYRPECAELPKVRAFRDWLLAEAGK